MHFLKAELSSNLHLFVDLELLFGALDLRLELKFRTGLLSSVSILGLLFAYLDAKLKPQP